jgi:hypothetical protein
VKNKQVRKQGKRSSARHPFEPAEFEQTLGMCNDLDGREKKYMRIPACCTKFQYKIVARLDDTTCRLEELDLKPNPQSSFHSHFFVECANPRMF